MRHRSVQSRAGSLTAAAVLAVGFGVSAAQAGFVLDLKLTGGGTSTTVTSGTAVSLDVFGTVTGTGAAAEGLQDAFFGVTNSGGHGDLSVVTLQSPFTGVATDVAGVTTSSSGSLYGAAGSKSVGSTDSTAADGWVFARSTSMTTVTAGTPVLLGQLSFTAGAAGTANLAINARQAVSSLVVPAVWQEDGAEKDGAATVGTGVAITVGAIVSHINGNTPGPNGNYLNTSGDLTKESVGIDDFNAVIANFGSTNAAGYAWPRTQGNAGGPVGIADFNAVIANFGHANDPSGVDLASSLAAVPEPASLSVLGVVGGLTLAGRRRRQA